MSLKWIVLAVSSLEAGTFASLFLNFATTPDITADIFSLDEDDGSIQWISTSGLLAIVAAFPFASWGLDNYNYITSAGTFVFIVLSAWLRYIALRTTTYTLVICSSVLLGAAGAVVITKNFECMHLGRADQTAHLQEVRVCVWPCRRAAVPAYIGCCGRAVGVPPRGCARAYI